MKYIIAQCILGFKEGWRDFWAPLKWLLILIRQYLWPK